jgi:hypothetical protein
LEIPRLVEHLSWREGYVARQRMSRFEYRVSTIVVFMAELGLTAISEKRAKERRSRERIWKTAADNSRIQAAAPDASIRVSVTNVC